MWSAVVVVAIIAIIGLFAPHSTQTIVEAPAPTLSATPISTNYSAVGIGINDRYVVQTARRLPLTTGTTTPCAIQSPSATSTLEWTDADITTATSTAITWTIATSTTAFATSSVLTQFTPVTSSLYTLVWYPTTTSGALLATSTGLLPPSSWVVFGASGIVGTGGLVTSGSCQAVFNLI